LELDPSDANHFGNFANFLWENRRNYNEAEWLYREALRLAPENAGHTANFAEFMERIREDFSEANRLYRLALELPTDCDWAKEEYNRFLNAHPEFAK
jgi:Tfp pilus assembly protein PilF